MAYLNNQLGPFQDASNVGLQSLLQGQRILPVPTLSTGRNLGAVPRAGYGAQPVGFSPVPRPEVLRPPPRPGLPGTPPFPEGPDDSVRIPQPVPSAPNTGVDPFMPDFDFEQSVTDPFFANEPGRFQQELAMSHLRGALNPVMDMAVKAGASGIGFGMGIPGVGGLNLLKPRYTDPGAIEIGELADIVDQEPELRTDPQKLLERFTGRTQLTAAPQTVYEMEARQTAQREQQAAAEQAAMGRVDPGLAAAAQLGQVDRPTVRTAPEIPRVPAPYSPVGALNQARAAVPGVESLADRVQAAPPLPNFELAELLGAGNAGQDLGFTGDFMAALPNYDFESFFGAVSDKPAPYAF